MTSQSSNSPRVLITGGYGCIGSETAKWLITNSDCHVVICSRRVDEQRGESVFGQHDGSRLTFLEVDVRNQGMLEGLLQDQEITHIAHMAGLQTPDCNNHRDLGLQVNLAGTQNLIEAVKARGIELQRLVFASSAAVYGPRAMYPPGRVSADSELQPVNVYGVWKLAGEHLCRIFAEETGVPTISLRPGALFGPGRDAGLTATPTTAIKHAAAGRAYRIPYRSRQDYLYSPDVGAAVGNTLLEPFSGYSALTLPSHTIETSRFVQSIVSAANELGYSDPAQISFGEEEVPFICDLDFTPFLAAFPNTPHTPFDDAVRQSLQLFYQQWNRVGTLPCVE